MVVEEYESDHDEAFPGSLVLGLADLPCNIRFVRDDENSNHDVFASADMEGHFEAFSESLRPGLYGHIFFSAWPLGVWYRILSKKVQEQDKMDWSCSDFDRHKEEVDTPVFEVESILLHYSLVDGY